MLLSLWRLDLPFKPNQLVCSLIVKRPQNTKKMMFSKSCLAMADLKHFKGLSYLVQARQLVAVNCGFKSNLNQYSSQLTSNSECKTSANNQIKYLEVHDNRYQNSIIYGTHQSRKYYSTYTCRRFFNKKPEFKKLEPPDIMGTFKEDRGNALAKLKIAIKQYGGVVFVLHIALSLCSLGIFYSVVYIGLPLEKLIQMAELGDYIGKLSIGGGTFAIAYAIHKMIMPVRVALTLIIARPVVMFLRAKKIIKRPPLE